MPVTLNNAAHCFAEGQRGSVRSLATLIQAAPSTSYPAAQVSRPFRSRQSASTPLCAAQLHSAEGSVHVAGDAPHHNGVYQTQHIDLGRKDHASFVHFFRAASSYITGHRGSLIVIVLPGQVFLQKTLLQQFLKDVTLLHGLGARLVLIVGAKTQTDAILRANNRQPQYVGGYRITDEASMQAATQAAGAARVEIEAQLSRALAVQMVRRHTRSNADQEYHYGPAIRVVSGNYVTGRRRGVVGGVDFGSTGSVRFTQVAGIQEQLEAGHIVLLTNLAYSAAGEPLNCNIFDVASHAAIELAADKLCFLTLDEVADMHLPNWLPINDAEALIDRHMAEHEGLACSVPPVRSGEIVLDLDCWEALQFPSSVLTSVLVCRNGVKRAHLVDARVDGGLLLELYSRDGSGTMISTDFYEGIRPASPVDTDAIADLLAPLAAAGITRHRSRKEIVSDLHTFTVVEREAKVLACAQLVDLGGALDGAHCGEVAAFCVDPAFRGSGRGDSLLDYIEQDARSKGIRRLMLLTTRAADWFEQRDFEAAGVAHESDLLPEKRRTAINPSRGSKLYSKELFDFTDSQRKNVTAPGKRIGF